MKLKNILLSVCKVLGCHDVTKLIEEGATESELQKNTNYSLLFKIANLVLVTVTSNYVDCKSTQRFTVTDGKVDYDSFELPFLKVNSVKKSGKQTEFTPCIGFVTVPNGDVEINYSFTPKFNGLDDTLKINGLSEQGFCYGVLAEYAFVSGMFSEARIWNEKFEALLFSTRAANKNVVIPKQEW